MTNLFGTPEAETARQLFYFMASRVGVDEVVLEQAWRNANLGINDADLRLAIRNATHARAPHSALGYRPPAPLTIKPLSAALDQDATMH